MRFMSNRSGWTFSFCEKLRYILRSVVLIEIGSINGCFGNRRSPGWGYLPSHKFIPVNTGEKTVIPNWRPLLCLIHSPPYQRCRWLRQCAHSVLLAWHNIREVNRGTESLLRISRQQALEQFPQRRRKVLGKGELPLGDKDVGNLGILVRPGGMSTHHFVQQDTKRPPVHRRAMWVALKHLRREILRCSTKGMCHCFRP